MANKNKARGTRFESAVTQFVRLESAGGVDARRPAQAGPADVGDVHVGEDWVIQAKDWAKWSKADLLRWTFEDVETQARNAARPFGAVVVKRRREAGGASGAVGEALVAMSMETFTAVLSELADLRDELERLDELGREV